MERNVFGVPATSEINSQLNNMMKERKIESRLMLILTKSYLMMQNRTAAKICIRECLTGNPYSSEALQTAIDAKLLNDRDIKKLLSPKAKKTTGSKIMTLLCELRCSKVRRRVLRTKAFVTVHDMADTELAFSE